MSLDIALKAGIILLGASAINLGGYKIYGHLTATLESKYSLMNEKNTKWNQLVTKYGTSTTPENLSRMENFTLTSTEDQTTQKNKLINHCKLILKTSLRENQETLNKREREVKDWCTEDATALNT